MVFILQADVQRAQWGTDAGVDACSLLLATSSERFEALICLQGSLFRIASVLIKYTITAKRRGLIINVRKVSRVGDSNMQFLVILDCFVNLVPRCQT